MTLDTFFFYFEWVAATIALTYVVFQILQKPLMWYLSIVAAIAYMIVFLHNRLYAMSAVQGYLIGAGIYGLIDWISSKHQTTGTENAGRIMIRPFEWKVGLVSIALSVVAFFVLHYLLYKAGNQEPWIDALLATNTMLATFYTGRRSCKLRKGLSRSAIRRYGTACFNSESAHETSEDTSS